MWAIYLTIGFVCLFLGFCLGLLLGGSGSHANSIGTINIVEWPDGTYDLLLQLERQLGELDNGQEVMVNVHKTRK